MLNVNLYAQFLKVNH